MSSLTISAAAPAAPKKNDRHFANRFSWGHTPGLSKQVKRAGGGRAWFNEQLSPERINDGKADQVNDWYPYLRRSPQEIWAAHESEEKPVWELMQDLGMWTMMRRVYTKRQLHETMADFWMNLLHVPIGDDLAAFYRVPYDRMIRKHALGNFEKMLTRAITHPAMGLYLDNAFSHKDAPNENLGRELLELHTVGIDGGYDEKDVKAAAKLLTGWRAEVYVDPEGVKEYYDPEWHHTGRLNIMGFRTANKDADGRKETKKLLKYLANHPATAQRIARRLCVKFVNDDPSGDLVRTVKRAWTRSGTDIKATLKAMVDHPEFASSAGAKVRMPLEEHIATMRALGFKPTRPASDDAFPRQAYWMAESQGQAPYDWPTPDGFPETNEEWSAPGRVLSSFAMHRAYTAWFDRDDVGRPQHTAWLPDLPAKFEDVVGHAGRRLLGRGPNDRLKQGVALRTGLSLSQRVTADEMNEDRVKHLLMCLLGSPAHMTR